MPSYRTSGFKDLSVSEDGIVASFTFSQRDGEDIEISLPGAALSIVLPYLIEAERVARRYREEAGEVRSASDPGGGSAAGDPP